MLEKEVNFLLAKRSWLIQDLNPAVPRLKTILVQLPSNSPNFPLVHGLAKHSYC